MERYTTPTPPMPEDWMAFGACISGSTALPWDATRPECGGVAMMNMTSAEAGLMAPPRASERGFLGVSALLFAVSAAVTIVWCTSMPAVGGLAMPGHSMGSAWMRMPGQTWADAASSFIGKWVVMMVAMMLPSLVPMLRRYREALRGAGESHLGLLTTIVGTGYFLVWAVFGMI